VQEAWVMLVKHDAQLGEALGRSQMHGRFALPATRRKVNAFLYFTERRRMATTRTWEPMERASAPRLSSDLTVLKWPLAAACMSADPVAIPPHQHTSTPAQSTEAQKHEAKKSRCKSLSSVLEYNPTHKCRSTHTFRGCMVLTDSFCEGGGDGKHALKHDEHVKASAQALPRTTNDELSQDMHSHPQFSARHLCS
jgi:hypothetical protein